MTAVVFPFDLFGSSGCGAGAQLLGDALREAVDDTAAEPRPTRPHAYADKLQIEEHPFEKLAQVTAWRATGREAIGRLLRVGEFVLWLAGNHLGVLPVYDELGPGDLVIQFDAHLDCYDLHDTTEELSHGNFLRHVVGPGPKVLNVGHRDLFLLPADVRRTFAHAIPAEAVGADTAARLRKYAAKAKRVWVDLDADVFDPALAPGVGQPQPFGLAPLTVLTLIAAVWGPKVAGVSVSEFDPGRDVRDQTLNLLGWLTERLLLKATEG